VRTRHQNKILGLEFYLNDILSLLRRGPLALIILDDAIGLKKKFSFYTVAGQCRILTGLQPHQAVAYKMDANLDEINLSTYP
jgi:hypothetical protein